MYKDSPVGFFDSGVGGLSVYARFRKELPRENTIYFGDLKNLPYGNKTQDELIGFAKNILDFFQQKGVKAVVIACNTSSALAYDAIKDDYNFKIYPIIQSCAQVISSMNISKVGIFATQGTVSSLAYTREITKYKPEMLVNEIACPNWVSIVEGVPLIGIAPDEDVKTHLDEMMKFAPEKIVLGCTHYPYLMDNLTQFVSKDLFIDPATIFVDFIKADLEKNTFAVDGKEEFFVSANPELFIKNAKLFYDVKNNPNIVNFL